MNQIHEAYEKIQLTHQDKEKIFNQLMEEKIMKKRILPYTIAFVACCLIFLAVPYIVSSSQKSSLPSVQEEIKTYKITVNQYEGTIDNKEGLDQFLSDYQNNQEVTLVITRSTREGDPIVTTVQYSKNVVTIIEDTTKDRFAETPSIKKMQYKHLGRFNDELYAYNDDLSFETIDNDDAYYILTLVYKIN